MTELAWQAGAYPGLLLLSFLAATLLPAQSEAALVALLLGGAHSPALLLLAATAGNVAGSALNWWLGREVARFRDRRWFPVAPAALERARGWYGRLGGPWSLLLSWLPVVGDPLTLLAGTMRVPLPRFLLLVTLGKGGRYLALAAAALAWR